MLIGVLLMVSGFFYFFVGYTLGINVWLTVFLVMLAHSASGANWVLSTILTQMWVEDEIRGRVFSIDMLIMSLTFSMCPPSSQNVLMRLMCLIDRGPSLSHAP